MTSSKLKLTFLSLVALVLLGLGMWAFFIIQSENRETSRLLNEVSQAVENESKIKSIEQVRNTASADIEMFESFILTDDRIVSAIEKIESAGRALGLETEIVSVDNVSNEVEENPQKIHLVVEAEGSWSESFSFLKAVENLPYKISLEDVSLVKTSTAWQSKITLSLYSFK